MSAATVPAPTVPIESPTPKPHQTGYPRARWALVGVLAFLLLGSAGVMLKGAEEARSFTAHPNLPAVIYTDGVKAAVTQKMDGAKSILQASFLVFAALWGVILAKKGEGKLVMGDWQEFFMLAFAVGFFLASWNCYTDYADSMSALQAQQTTTFNPDDPKETMIPDFRAGVIERIADRQYTFFLLAVLATGVTLFSAHILKEASPCTASSPPAA